MEESRYRMKKKRIRGCGKRRNGIGEKEKSARTRKKEYSFTEVFDCSKF